ncbi:sugar O-acetyltransferase [Butyricicoccus sp.]|uniref:sugar O-acetyltransferase n=1 Tax=Butyricicoccus sp. TaxID=2049021 RepID=UPI003F1888C4
MTEKEKRAQGLLYDANYNPEISQELLACKDICFQYNQILPSHEEERCALMKQLLGKTGKAFCIQPPFWCDFGYNIEIGENFYANHGCIILDGAKVTFGDNVFVAPNCGFHTAGHPLDVEQRNQGLEYAWPITVGDNVWIGANVTVLPGVTIGSGSVIGAGSVVNRDIPSGVIAAGNPCRVVREITEEDRDRYRRGMYRK